MNKQTIFLLSILFMPCMQFGMLAPQKNLSLADTWCENYLPYFNAEEKMVLNNYLQQKNLLSYLNIIIEEKKQIRIRKNKRPHILELLHEKALLANTQANVNLLAAALEVCALTTNHKNKLHGAFIDINNLIPASVSFVYGKNVPLTDLDIAKREAHVSQGNIETIQRHIQSSWLVK